MTNRIPETGTEEHQLMPPQLFQHGRLFDLLGSAKGVGQEELINLVNYLHFSDRHIYAILQHPTYGEYLSIKIYPEPCLNSELICRWDDSYFRHSLASYPLKYLFIPQEQFVILVPLQSAEPRGRSFSIRLPGKGYALNERRQVRFACHDISGELMQNGIIAQGKLVDFSPQSFRINVIPDTSKIKNWFNSEVVTSVRLFSDRETFFYGSCRPIRRQDKSHSEDIVFSPARDHIVRLQPKKIRNPRRQITPHLAAVFVHPLFKKRIQRDITELSTTGFSIQDVADTAILMPGMMISNVSISHAGITVAICAAQVIRRHVKEDVVHYGIFIVDMDIRSYSRICNLLGAYADPHISVSTEVDMDALWEFFFESGFIYPAKYSSLQAHRKSFTETYRKLYQENQDVARHVTYTKKGKIYGHMSMVRAYERTWLIHHHASRPMQNKLPGYVILRHIMLFLHGAYTLPSSHMDYVMCFFRPDNEFPDRLFGGFSRELNNPRGCSLDSFSYLSVSVKGTCPALPAGWSLNKISPPKMWELENFYRRTSGGLFLDVLRNPQEKNEEPLSDIFKRCGFTRKWFLYELCYENRLICVAIVNQSDFGVNLSELLNSITVMVIEKDLLAWDVLLAFLSQLVDGYKIDKVPLLIYPDWYVDAEGIPCEKRYNMWITDMQYSNAFMEFVQRKFRMRYE